MNKEIKKECNDSLLIKVYGVIFLFLENKAS